MPLNLDVTTPERTEGGEGITLTTHFRALDSTFTWFCKPKSYSFGEDGLSISPEAKTDLWQGTHYPAYSIDNAHELKTTVQGDFVLTLAVCFKHVSRFDQYGLIVKVSEQCWIKASIEYDPPGPPKLGAVVPNFSFSDWSSQSCAEVKSCNLRIRREGLDFIVESNLPGEASWQQIRVAHLHQLQTGAPIEAGIYAAAPTAAGGSGCFKLLRILSGRLSVPTDA